MAYNNGYPMSYQQLYYPLQNQPQNPASSGIIWVQGEAGAKSYLVAPGQSVLLMDSENELFYIKSTDVSGMPLPLRKFSYKEVAEAVKSGPEKSFNPDLYLTKEEFENRLKQLKIAQKEVDINDYPTI